MADLTIVFHVFSNSWGSGILMVIAFAKPLLADDYFIIYMTDDYDDYVGLYYPISWKLLLSVQPVLS